MTAPETVRGARVLLALQSSGGAGGSVEVALRLAVAMRAELAGVFVEDADLLRVAALPFTREVGLVSGIARPLEAGDVEQALRARAEQVRRSLARLAEAARVQWSFRVARSNLSSEMLTAAGQADVAVAGEPRRSAAGASTAAAQAGETITAVLDASAAGGRALAAALNLAEGQPQRLSLLVPGGSAADLSALRQRAAQGAPAGAAAPRAAALRAPQADEVVRETRRQRSGVLVVSAGSLPDIGTQLRRLLEDSGCPLVLVL